MKDCENVACEGDFDFQLLSWYSGSITGRAITTGNAATSLNSGGLWW